MAIIKCDECGNNFSDYAKACPKCGCPTEVMKKGIIKSLNSQVKNVDEINATETSDSHVVEIPKTNQEKVEKHDVISENSSAQIIPEKQNESVIENEVVDATNLKNQSEKRNKNLTVIFLIGFVVVGILVYFYFTDFIILEEAKHWHPGNGYTIEDQVKGYLRYEEYVRTIGWEKKNVEDGVYFISYGFDYDNDSSNGYVIYCFEYDRNNDLVVEIVGNPYYERKYRRLGYIE